MIFNHCLLTQHEKQLGKTLRNRLDKDILNAFLGIRTSGSSLNTSHKEHVKKSWIVDTTPRNVNSSKGTTRHTKKEKWKYQSVHTFPNMIVLTVINYLAGMEKWRTRVLQFFFSVFPNCFDYHNILSLIIGIS